jgi:hypothetical protein
MNASPPKIMVNISEGSSKAYVNIRQKKKERWLTEAAGRFCRVYSELVILRAKRGIAQNLVCFSNL